MSSNFLLVRGYGFLIFFRVDFISVYVPSYVKLYSFAFC